MSNTETYVPPTAGSSFGAGAAMGGGSNYASSFQEGPMTQYLCGDCSSTVGLRKGDPIRCKECGHRILYKERTKRLVQFEAR